MMIYNQIFQPFVEYGFMRRALVACIALSISGAPLGIFLVLKRMTLVGDAMTHAILPGASISFMIFGLSLLPMTFGGLAAGMIIALIAGLLTHHTKLKEDASFTGTYIISLAFGVIIISMKGTSIDLMHILFGNVLAVNNQSLILICIISSVSLLILSLIYRGLIVECLDKDFMRVSKTRGAAIYQLFLFLMVLNLVSAFQALGTLMALGLMVLPSIAAGFWSRNIDYTISLSVLFALISSFSGLLISFYQNTPSGPSIVLAAGFIYVISIIFGRYGSLTSGIFRKKHYKH